MIPCPGISCDVTSARHANVWAMGPSGERLRGTGLLWGLRPLQPPDSAPVDMRILAVGTRMKVCAVKLKQRVTARSCSPDCPLR